MRKAPTLTILTLFLLSIGLRAQGLDDAIFNAPTYYEGTARSMAMGNATGALGGDITATCINPAGLGLYRSSELTFSTGLQHYFINSSYYNNSQNAGKMRMSIPNFGLVMGGEVSNYKPLRYFQLGIGLTRTNDFNYHYEAFGLNPNSSMIDSYIQTINGIDELFNPDIEPGDYLYDNYPYDLSPAWETFLIDRFTDSVGDFFYDSPVPPGNVRQNDDVVSKGRSEEWTFAFGGNLYEKLFLGTSFGLTHLKRISTRTYTETPANLNNSFSSWEHQEELGDTAWGVNFKCGVIYYPASWLRIGAAWHSRTHYVFGETWSTETSATLKNDQNGQEYHRYLSPTIYPSYDFRTPHTFIGSLAFFLGQHGLLTTDVEYLNYGKCRFSSDDFSFSDANNDIKNTLQSTYNLRIGAEWRVRQFFVRSGAAYYGSPFGFGEKYGSVKKLCLGIGYASSDDTSWDFAYELTRTTKGYFPYQYFVDNENIVNEVTQHWWRNKLVVTMKIKL